MTANNALADVRAALRQLERAVGGLVENIGDTLTTRRLRTDVRRLDEDLEELGEVEQDRRVPPEEIVYIEDTPPDPDMWRDSEDEGLGAPDKRAP